MKSPHAFMLMFFFLLFTFTTTAQDQIIGNWFSKEMKNATIQVYQADDGFIYGKLIDCDKEEWIGETILKKVTYDESKQAWTGEIYSLERKMTINATFTMASEEKLKLVGKKFFMTKTFYWKKDNQ